MRSLLWVALAATLAACGAAKKKPAEVYQGNPADNLSIGCYTVDLFDPYRIQYPESGVSAEDAKFLGVWKDAAWSPEDWCHDLYITEVRADGTAILLDAYGPNTKRGTEAVVFKRTANIKDGVLTFSTVGSAAVKYRIVDGYLVGERKDLATTLKTTMRRADGIAFVPVPPRNPRRT